jgi:predicted component of type VI protein secretion system
MRFVLQVQIRRAGDAAVLAQQSLSLASGGELTFGRAADNDIVVPDPERRVSSHHGRIRCDDTGTLHAVDAGSLNGTRLGGQPIDGERGRPLASGAVLTFCDFELQLDFAPEAPPMPTSALEAHAVDEPGSHGLAGASLTALRALAARFVPCGSLETEADVQRLGAALGTLVDAATRWIASSVQSRVVFEREFGAEVTMLFQRSNNPLKELPPHELNRFLLDWREATPDATRQTYLDGLLHDLAEHQLGVLAGVRDAIGDIVARIAPERVMALSSQEGGWSLASKSARAWATYEKLYAELVHERDKLFHEVISPAIQQGYLQRHEQQKSSPPQAPNADSGPP